MDLIKSFIEKLDALMITCICVKWFMCTSKLGEVWVPPKPLIKKTWMLIRCTCVCVKWFMCSRKLGGLLLYISGSCAFHLWSFSYQCFTYWINYIWKLDEASGKITLFSAWHWAKYMHLERTQTYGQDTTLRCKCIESCTSHTLKFQPCHVFAETDQILAWSKWLISSNLKFWFFRVCLAIWWFQIFSATCSSPSFPFVSFMISYKYILEIKLHNLKYHKHTC